MKFHKVEIENFGTIGPKVTLPLSDQGLVLVTGVNKDTAKADSNGAGKSLLLDAFCWSIWGRTIREDKDDDVVNRHVGKNCLVKVYFEEKGKEYAIARYRKHKKSKKPNDLELYLGETNVSSTSMANTQDVINSIIGVNFNTFCAMMPGSGKNAAQMTDADIKELLENMLQISTLAKARELARKERDEEIKPAISELDVEIAGLLKQKEHAEIRLKGFEQESETFETKQAEKLEILESQEKQTRESIEAEDVTIKAGLTASEESERVKMDLSVHKRGLQNTRKTLGDLATNFIEYRHAQHATIQSMNRDIKNYKGHLVRIAGLGDTCAACNQAVSDDHKRATSETVRRNIELAEKEIALAEHLIETKNEEEEELTAGLLEMQEKARAEIEILEASLVNLTNTINEGNRASVKKEMLQKDLERISHEKAAVEHEESPYAHWIVDTKKELIKLQKASQAATKKRLELEEKLKMLDFWQTAFSASGIRSYILDNITPVLNERAKHYCDLLTDGEMGITFSTKTKLKSGDIREKFSININQKHGGGTYKSNSKGERQRANLAVSFALGDLAELHSNKRIPFRFLDEPFEGIDESGTDAVLALLIEQQDKYPTVFVVTHMGHFKELFPQEITMVKEKGFSRLESKNA